MKTPFIYSPFFFSFSEWNRSLFYGETAAVIRRGLYEKKKKKEIKRNLLVLATRARACIDR
jgi:hypothetical protein